MLDSTLLARFQKLVKTKINERRKQFPSDLMQIDNQAAVSGMLRSSGRTIQTHQAYERELEIRSIIAWQSLVRVHRNLGCPMSAELRNDLKSTITNEINNYFTELTQDLLARVSTHQKNMDLTLAGVQQHLFEKHDVEIDLYVDALTISNSNESPHHMTQQYNFYGSINGAVQTGPNSIANVVQHLGAEDRASLSTALSLVREVLGTSPSVEEAQRQELLEIANECSSQLDSASPNNTKLLTMFNVLGSAIQSIASAQPAYQALKAAVLPLGITLP